MDSKLQSIDEELVAPDIIPGIPCQLEEQMQEHTCTVQRSPLHPHTPRRRSPDHSSLGHSTQGATENSSNPCNSDLDINGHDVLKIRKSAISDAERNFTSDGNTGTAALENQFQQLLLENARLKDELDSRGGDDIMTQQLLQQLQAAMADKSKINKEKDELVRENGDLRTLLAYLSGENSCYSASEEVD